MMFPFKFKGVFQNKGKSIVEISLPPVKIDENTVHIFYISTSMGSISYKNMSFMGINIGAHLLK
jgi:hypothetical protein